MRFDLLADQIAVAFSILPMADETLPPSFEKQLVDYRNALIASEQQAIDEYDKAIMTMSAAALGVSFAFIKDIVKPENMVDEWKLISAWTCWGASIVCVVTSFYASHWAMRRAIRQLDQRDIYLQVPGGWPNVVTEFVNAAGGILFIVGLIFLTNFVAINISHAKSRPQTLGAAARPIPPPRPQEPPPPQPRHVPNKQPPAQPARPVPPPPRPPGKSG